VAAPPAIVNGKQLRLSWSRLRSHEECRAQGALQALGHRSPVADIRGYFHGTVVDRAMGKWLSMDSPPAGWMAEHVAEILEAEEITARETDDGIVKWKSVTDKAEVKEYCRELCTRLEVILTKLCLPHEWEPHVRFSVPLEVPYLDGELRQIMLVGEMDLLVRQARPAGADPAAPREVGIFDLKATKDNSYWRKVEGQMAVYDVAWWGMTGQFPVISALIQPMCDTQVLPFRFTEQTRRELFTRICRVSMDIFRNDLSPKAGSSGCEYCPVRHACPKFAVPGGHGRVRAFFPGVVAA
jgi:hypothetical protein